MRSRGGPMAARSPRSSTPVEAVGALDVRGDQVVLGGEQPVERGGGHLGLGGDRVNAGGADAVPVEELVGDREDVSRVSAAVRLGRLSVAGGMFGRG